MTGGIELDRGYIGILAPMVWTTSQRESFVDDVQRMRIRVTQNVSEGPRYRELKLGHDELRDVESATQLLQLAHDRYDDSLCILPTVIALDALVEVGYIDREDDTALTNAYEFVHLLEHRLQLQKMRRTHLLPAGDDTKALQ